MLTGRNVMTVSRIVGLLMVLTALMVGIGSNLPSMIDPASLSLVLGTVLGMLLIGRHNIGTMVSAVFAADTHESKLREAIHGYRMGRYYCMPAAGVCLGVGVVIMLKSLDDPAAIGPGMAIALLGSLYALLLGFVLFLGLQSGLEKRLGEPVEDTVVPAALLALVFCTVLAVAVFAMLIMSFSVGS
jgi:flagellar motor component MotA